MKKLNNLVQNFLTQKKVAVVGVSDKRDTGCNLAYQKFKENGYQVYAVNPRMSAKSAVISRRWPARSCSPSADDSRSAACGAKRASSVRWRSTVANSWARTIAIAAWSAKCSTSPISRSENGRTSFRAAPITPSSWPS